jgi:hypothetical protein
MVKHARDIPPQVELSKREKVGNIEKKLYRATATGFVPQNYFDFKPKDAHLHAAFGIYSEILKNTMMAKGFSVRRGSQGDARVDFQTLEQPVKIWSSIALIMCTSIFLPVNSGGGPVPRTTIYAPIRAHFAHLCMCARLS